MVSSRICVARLPGRPQEGRRDALRALLSAEEQARHSIYVRDDDQDRFLVSRAALRTSLARVLGVAARDVPIRVGPHGKPFVDGGPEFSVSHSSDVVLVAISDGAPVGIDVEAIREQLVHELPIEAVYTAAEVAALRELPGDLRVAAFFHTWTSREAVVKMSGHGLSLQRDTFDVSVDPRLPPSLLVMRRAFLASEAVSLRSIEVAAGHVATLAVAARANDYALLIADETC